MSRAASIGELPAAGNRNGSNVNNVGDNGNYWSSSANDSNNAYNVNFNSSNVNPDNNDNRNNGYSVRLITASIGRPPAHGSFRFLLFGTQHPFVTVSAGRYTCSVDDIGDFVTE